LIFNGLSEDNPSSCEVVLLADEDLGFDGVVVVAYGKSGDGFPTQALDKIPRFGRHWTA